MGQKQSKQQCNLSEQTSPSQQCVSQPQKSFFNYSVFKILVGFLTLPDLHNLSLTCRQLNDYQKQYYPIYALHLYRNFLSEQIKLPLEMQFMDYPGFICERERVAINLMHHTHDNSWLDLLKSLMCIKYCVSEHETKQLKAFPFLDMLCQPQFTRPILKRETLGIYCVTEFQNMLAQRLELEQKGLDKLFDAQFVTQKHMQNLKDNKKQLIEQCLSIADQEQKDQFLRLRWFICQEQLVQQQSIQPMLIHVFQLLVDSTNQYCQAVSKLLQEHKCQNTPNAYDLLVDYCLYWQAFSSSILEMEVSLIPLEQILNELSGEMLATLPQYPKFSFWRCMTKSWLENIYNNQFLDDVLEQCFFKIIKQRRNQLMLIQFQDVKPNKDETFVPTLDYITKELYDSFVNRSNYPVQFFDYNIDASHNFFETQASETDRLIGMFYSHIQDISLNEVSVHWMGHTDCQYEQPFERLQNQFLRETSLHYEQQSGIFKNNFCQYMKFLEWDLKYVSMITCESQVHQVLQLQKEHLYTQLSLMFSQKLITPFLETHTLAVAKTYHIIDSSEDTSIKKKSDRSSFTSWLGSENNLSTNEEEPTQSFFNYLMEHPNYDIQEELLLQRIKSEPDPLSELIKVVLQDQHVLIEFAQCEHDQLLNSDMMSSMMSSKETVDSLNQFYVAPQKQIMRSYSQIKKSQHLFVVPEELVCLIRAKIIENEEYSDVVHNFQAFCMNFERSSLKFTNRDQEIECLNESRELPKILPPQVEQFYSVSKKLTFECVVAQQIVEVVPPPQDDDLEAPVMSKTSSKIKNQFEEYNSEEEEEMSTPPPPPPSKLKR